MKRKVVELIDTLNDGGAETLIKDYALMINRDEFDLYIVVMLKTPQTANYRIVNESGTQIISLYRTWNIFTKVFNKVLGKRYLRYRLRRVIEEIQPDVIHAHLAIIRTLADVRDCL